MMSEINLNKMENYTKYEKKKKFLLNWLSESLADNTVTFCHPTLLLMAQMMLLLHNFSIKFVLQCSISITVYSI